MGSPAPLLRTIARTQRGDGSTVHLAHVYTGRARPWQWAVAGYGDTRAHALRTAGRAVLDSLDCQRCNQLASIRTPDTWAALDGSTSTAQLAHTCALAECQTVRCPRCAAGYHRPGSVCVWQRYGKGNPHYPRWDRVCKCGVRIFPAPPDLNRTAPSGGTV